MKRSISFGMMLVGVLAIRSKAAPVAKVDTKAEQRRKDEARCG